MDVTDRPVLEKDQKKGLRIYKIKGVDKLIVARKGGPTKEQVQTSPAYAELRKNQQEFGLASSIAKTIRQSFTEPLQAACESYISGKLTAKVRSLVKEEEGPIGTRPFLLSKHSDLLKGFQFNADYPFEKVFTPRVLSRPGQHRGHVIFHVPSFTPEEVIQIPEGATHFKLFAHMIALSDYRFDESQQHYQVAESHGYGMHQTVEGPLSPLLRIPLDPMTFHLSMEPEGGFKEDTSLLVMVGIQFLQFRHTEYKLHSQGHAMEIHQIL